MRRLEKKHLIILGLGVLSVVFLLVPFFLEGDGSNNYLEIGLEEQLELDEEEDYDEFDLELEKYETEADYAVYVSGEVKVPGVYYLPAGSRVYEALREAGEALENAGLDRLNLAAKVRDGQHIHVPDKDEELDFDETITSTTSKEMFDNGLININEADNMALKELPGIGPARAKTILDYRETNGSFSNASDIMKVPGIGTGIFEQIKDSITT